MALTGSRATIQVPTDLPTVAADRFWSATHEDPRLIATDAKPSYCSSCGVPTTGGRFCANCGTPLSPVGAPAVEQLKSRAGDFVFSWAGALLLVGGIIGIVGSFLPWIMEGFNGTSWSLNAFEWGSSARAGLNYTDLAPIVATLGIAVPVLATALALLGYLLLRRGSTRYIRRAAAVCASIMAGLSLAGIVAVLVEESASRSFSVAMSLGGGLEVMVLASILALVGVVLPRPPAEQGA